MNKWRYLARAFQSLGDTLSIECENLSVNSDIDTQFDALYTNYAQLLHTIKAGQEFIHARFDGLDSGGQEVTR